MLRALIFIFLLLTQLWHPALAAEIPIKDSVCFTPGEDCSGFVVRAIHQAKHTILVQAYHLTDIRMTNALIEAHQHGVRVLIIMDRQGLHTRDPHFKNPRIVDFLNNDIPVWVDNRPRIAHNKVIIIDQASVLTGSFNFTYSAQNYNTENIVWLHQPDIVVAYTRNFFNRLMVSHQLLSIAFITRNGNALTHNRL